MDFIDSQDTSENIPIGRVASGETDDSPFSSNLVTPTDDSTVPFIVRPSLYDGIDEKIIIAKASLDYFTSGRGDIGNGAKPDAKQLEASARLETDDIPLVEPGRFSPSQTSVIADDGGTPNISTLDSSQTFPSPHPSLAEIVAQARRSSSALYSLPNSHISIEDKKSDESGSDAEGDDTILKEEEDSLLLSKQSTSDLLFSTSWPEDLQTVVRKLTIQDLYFLACQIFLFLPWCIAVGGAIALSPTNLSAIAFSPSVNYISRPSTSIRLFAHWAEYGLPHFTVFAGFVFTIIWTFPKAGTILLGALCAQFCWAWHDFLPERTTALGEDERQMIYHLAKGTWLTGNTVGIKKVNGKYYATDYEVNDTGVDSDSGSGDSDCNFAAEYACTSSGSRECLVTDDQ